MNNYQSREVREAALLQKHYGWEPRPDAIGIANAPEPSTWILVGCALLAVWLLRRVKRSVNQ